MMIAVGERKTQPSFWFASLFLASIISPSNSGGFSPECVNIRPWGPRELALKAPRHEKHQLIDHFFFILKKVCLKRTLGLSILSHTWNNVFLDSISLRWRFQFFCFEQFTFGNDCLEKHALKRIFYLFRKMVRNAEWWSKSNLPLFLTAICSFFLK